MTVKALKRQLMAAIAMIMVSLIALSSSTYAWFTMNKTVTAKGLTVKARTEGGILIRRALSNKAEDSTMFASSSTVNLFPTNKGPTPSNKDFKQTWVHATASRGDSSAADPNTYAQLEIQEYEPGSTNLGYGFVGTSYNSGNFYYVYDSFVIQKDKYSKSFTDLYVSACTVEKKKANENDSAAVAAISKALRVLVKCGDTEFIYAPVQGATDDYDIVTVTKTGTTVTTTKQNINTYKTTQDGNLIPVFKNTSGTGTMPLSINDGYLYKGVYGENAGEEGLEVKVYVYFEGEDASLMANNIQYGLDDLILTIKFSCSDVTPE